MELEFASGLAMRAASFFRSSSSPGQIQHGKKENPDDVHEMPVQGAQFHAHPVQPGPRPDPSADGEIGRYANAYRQVEGVDSGQDEILGEEKPRMQCVASRETKPPAREWDKPCFRLLAVFIALDGQECQTQEG